MRSLWKRPAALLMGLALVGCASLRGPGLAPLGASRTITLSLQPTFSGARQAQTVVSPYTASSINRLDVVAYVEAAANVYQPVSAASGDPTSESDPQLLKLSQSSPSINLNRSFTFTNLKPNHRYRFYARAYATGGALISTDAYSYSEVTLTTNDRPTMAATLPLKLVDRSFAAATSVTVSNSGGSGYEQVVASLVKVVNGSEVAVSGATQTIARASIPKTLQLAGLQSNTTYRLKVSARKADSTEVATAAVAVAVGTNDAPTAQSVAFNAPASYVVSTYGGAYYNTPYGIARDPSSGLLYVANYGGNSVLRVYSGDVQQVFATGLSGPSGIAVDASGNVFVTDTGSNTIVKITAGGAKSTFASGFNAPWDLCIDAAGTLYVADGYDNAVKKVTSAGAVTTLATGITNASGVAVDASGTVYATAGGGILYKITPGGSVSTLASGLNAPCGLAVDPAGNVLVATHHAIKQVSPTGTVTTIAGSDTQASLINGAASSARFNFPVGVVRASNGVLYVTDSNNNAIRQIVP